MNGIKRKRTLGIAKQSSWGTAASNANYWLPVLDFVPGEEVIIVENEANTGSIHKANDISSVIRMARPTITVKVSENEFPEFLSCFGTVSSALVPSETAVYEHTITFTNSNQKAIYSLFLDDPDRKDLVFDSFRIDTLNITFEKGGYIQAEIAGLSRYPEEKTITPSINPWLEFNAKNCAFSIADQGGSLTTINLLTASLNHSFNVSDDADNFYLGDTDLGTSFNKESEFSHEIGLHFPDFTFKDKWAAGTKQAFRADIVDTSRYINGSTQNTHPLIRFDYPSAYFSAWAEEGGAGDILKQNLTIKVLDDVSNADSPIKITVRNSVSSY